MVSIAFIGIKMALAIMNDSYQVSNQKLMDEFAFQVEHGGTVSVYLLKNKMMFLTPVASWPLPKPQKSHSCGHDIRKCFKKEGSRKKAKICEWLL